MSCDMVLLWHALEMLQKVFDQGISYRFLKLLKSFNSVLIINLNHRLCGELLTI